MRRWIKENWLQVTALVVCVGLALLALPPVRSFASGPITAAYMFVTANGGTAQRGTTLNFGNTASVTWTASTSGGITTVDATSSGGGGGSPTFTISNATTTGTTSGSLAALTGAPSTAITPTTSATGGVVGICTSGCGTSGSATITIAGSLNCNFDGSTTAGHYVQISAMTRGDCTDAGATYPTAGQVVGRVLSTNTGAGAYGVDLFPSEILGYSSSSGGNPTFSISNATTTGTTSSSLVSLTGAPSTGITPTTSATGGVVGICTSGCGTSGTATITIAGSLNCNFDGSTTAGDYVQISSMTRGDCTDAGATYPTSGQVLGRVLSTNTGAGAYGLDLFPSEIKGYTTGGGGGGFFQTLTAPVAANFTQLNYNTGSGVTTTQTDNSSPVTSITLDQNDPNVTENTAALAKNKIAATFTVTIAYTAAIIGQNSILGLWLSDGGSPPNNFFVTTQANVGLRIPLFSSFTAYASDVLGPNANWPYPQGPLVWLRVQETVSARNYFTSSDGINFVQFFTESNTAHFTTAQYGIGVQNRDGGSSSGGANVTMTLYSFTESNP